MTTQNMHILPAKYLPKIARMSVKERDRQNAINKQRNDAREHARQSGDREMLKALELAEKGCGVEDVMGDYRWPLVNKSFARLLVLGVP